MNTQVSGGHAAVIAFAAPSSRRSLLRLYWLIALLAMVLASAVHAQALPGADEPRKALRICRDPNNLPFQNAKGEGFEDKIAQLFADELKLPLQAYDYPARFNFVRNTLRFKLPGDDYPCDLIMDLPVGFGGGVNVTSPYYRSTFAMVFSKSKSLAGITSIEQFLALPQEKLAKLKIGVIDKSPAADWLAKRGLIDLGVPYQALVADPEKNSGQIIEQDLIAGKIDAVIIWGPIAGYYARRYPDAQLLVLPMQSEKNVKFDFEIAMGVRYGEKAWKQTIEDLIAKNQSKIDAILTEYGVPLVAAPAGGDASSPGDRK